MTNMYSQKHFEDIAKVVAAQYKEATERWVRSSLGPRTVVKHVTVARATVVEMAVALGGSFASDNPRFVPEKFFTACGFDKELTQKCVNRLGALTSSDVDALHAAINRA